MATYAVFLLATSLLAHWHFSRLGYNPTDDGVILAYGRRLLLGQVPYRDFVAIYMLGSAALHAPVVQWGGSHMYLISRFVVWFELATIALCWTWVTGRLVGAGRDPLTTVLIAAVAFVLGAHYFPIMAWHTIDGLFLSGLGLALCQGRSRTARDAGYLLIGAAFVCRQNYLPLLPVAIVLHGDLGRLRAWAAGSAPGLCYFALLACTSALPDAVMQLTTHTDLLSAGFERYLWEYATAWGLALGYAVSLVLHRAQPLASGAGPGRPPPWDEVVAMLAVFAALAACAWAMTKGRFLGAPSFGIFGMAMGAALVFVMEQGASRGRAAAGALVVTGAWCASISIGYNTPALASGMCAGYLLWLVRLAPAARGLARSASRSPALYALLAAGALVAFVAAREKFVYLDRPADELTFRLDGILPGGEGLLTNQNTYSFLLDLNQAISQANGQRYAILPDCAGYWAQSSQANPLPSDWPQSVMLGRPELLSRFNQALDRQRGSLTILVQKVQAEPLAGGFAPLPDGPTYAVTGYVRRTFGKVGETRFFDIYR